MRDPALTRPVDSVVTPVDATVDATVADPRDDQPTVDGVADEPVGGDVLVRLRDVEVAEPAEVDGLEAAASDAEREPLTLQERIDAAEAGEEIAIAPGVYSECLTLHQHLVLRGTEDGVVLAPAQGPAIALMGCGLTLDRIALKPKTGHGIVIRPALRAQPATRPIVNLNGCQIEAPGWAVMAMIAAVTVRMDDSTISGPGSGLSLQVDSALRMESTAISVQNGRGIVAEDRAILQLSGTTIERCGSDGIRLGRESIVWMDRDESVMIRGNGGHGLALGTRSTATLRGTEIVGNGGWGIQAPGCQLTITDVVNAANGYGALDPRGGPVLTGEWLTSVQIAGASDTPADPNGESARTTDTVAESARTSQSKSVGDDSPNEPFESSVDSLIAPVPDGSDVSGRVELAGSIPTEGTPGNRLPLELTHPSRVAADDLLLRLALIDGVDAVRLADPRFRWLVRTLPPAAGRVELLVDALESAISFPIVPERTVRLLEQVLDYAVWLDGQPLDEELYGIVASIAPPRMTEPMLARLGWSGKSPVTLQAAAEAAGVTRERIRQVQVRIEGVLGAGNVWAPALDRVLTMLTQIVPVDQDAASGRLAEGSEVGAVRLALDGILEAQRVLGRTTGLELIDRSGIKVLVGPGEADDPLLDQYAAIRTTIRKRVSNQGIATLIEVRRALEDDGHPVPTADLARVVTQLDDYRLVDGDHLVPAEWDRRNPLWNRLAKILAVAPGIAVETVAAQLSRDDRRGYPAAPRTLRLFVEAHPDLDLRNDRLYPQAPIDVVDVLSDTEQVLIRTFREHGRELSATDLVRLVVGPSFTRVTLAVRLAHSPVVVRLAYNRYRLIDPDDTPAGTAAPGTGASEIEVLAGLEGSNADDVLASPGVDGDDWAEEGGGDVAAIAIVDAVVRPALAEGSGDAIVPEPGLAMAAVEIDAPVVVAARDPTASAPSIPDPRSGHDVRQNVDDDEHDELGSGARLPALVMAPGAEVNIRLPDPSVAPLHELVADLFAGRLAWPAETRRQRWAATRLPDLLDAIYHGLPLGPLVLQRQEIPTDVAVSRRSVTALMIIDGQQRLAWLARLFNPSYRVPGQPQLPPVRVTFQPDTARFGLAGLDSAADPFLIADIGPLLRADVSPWRIIGDYLTLLRTVRTVDDVTADRLATAIGAVASLRDVHLTVQLVDDRLQPDAIDHLYDRLHRS